jgi:hypothetical protein
MIQLTYISSATASMDEQQVAAILQQSRLNNAAAGITGLLLYDGRRFLQALEGPSQAVDTVYQRIKADARHRALVLLSSRAVTDRAFGDWAMAAQRVTGGIGGSVTDQVDALTAEVADANLRALFRSFAQVRAAA